VNALAETSRGEEGIHLLDRSLKEAEVAPPLRRSPVQQTTSQAPGSSARDAVKFKQCISGTDQPVFVDRIEFDASPIFQNLGTTPVRSHFFDSSPRPPGQPFREKLLNVGYLYRGKGLDLLLQAMQLLVQAGKNPSLTLVGYDPERPALERLAERLAIRDRVIFVGHEPKNFLSPFYRGNDIFVLPTRYEGLGKVLIEAALTGLPVVTTHIGPTAEAVLPDETALLVPPNDPKALAIAINALLEHPEQARTMRERGRPFARRHFDYEGMMDDLVVCIIISYTFFT